jgi:legumain
MFKDTLPNNINVFVTTASNYNESSYACYYDLKRETYLGDLYSVNWMEDSDAENLASETLSTQFSIVKNLTDLSHVQEYGDTTISTFVVGAFQGQQSSLKTIRAKSIRAFNELAKSKAPKDAVPSYDVPLDILFRRLSKTTCENSRAEIKQEINAMLTKRQAFENTFRNIIKKVAKNEEQVDKWHQSQPKKLTQLDCHHELVHSFHTTCFNFGQNPYAMKFAYVLANMCEDKVNVQETIAIFKVQCSDNVIGERSGNVIGQLNGVH